MNTIIVCGIIILITFLVIRKMYKDKKQGKSSCGCGCGCCTISENCESKNEEE